MTTMEDFRRMAAAMDERVRQLAAEGVSDAEVFSRMTGYMPELHRIWVGTKDHELALLSQEFPGFYRYARIMEDAFEKERRDPRHKAYKDLPELPEPLKRPLTDLLTTAATLERGYQSILDGNHSGADQFAELNRLHDQWLAGRERFVEASKAADVPQKELDLIGGALGEMGDRITQLKRRMTTTAEQHRLAQKIDTYIKSIEARGGDDEEILTTMLPEMPTFHALLKSSTQAQMNVLASQYNGFRRFGVLLTQLAGAIKDGRIQLPPA